MPDVTVSELSPAQRQLVTRAKTAWEQGQADYVLALAAQLLAEVPGCVAMRRLQHVAQGRTQPEAIGWWSKARGALALRAGRIRSVGDPDSPATAMARFKQAEAALVFDPRNRLALQRLAVAATALDWPETAELAWERCRTLAPDDVQAGLGLTQVLQRLGRLAEAADVINQVVRIHPHHAEAQVLARDISVALTLRQGRWEGDGTFRDKLRE